MNNFDNNVEAVMNTNANLKNNRDSLACVSADMVPDEEKAVSIDWSKLSVTLDYVDEVVIPEDERAEEISSEERGLLLKRAKMTTLHGMGHISGVLDDRVYALIQIDENNKRTYIICIDQGESVPTKIEVEQAFLVRLVKAGFNMNLLEKRERKKVLERVEELEDQVFNTWESCDMPFDFLDVLNAVYYARERLPEKRIMALDERHEFYDRVKGVLDTFATNIFDKKSYYMVMPEDVKVLAKELHMTERKLLKKLNDLDLLYKQPSSVGYQVKVRIGDTTEWMVCIFKLEYFEKLQEQKMGYQTDVDYTKLKQPEPQKSVNSTN